MTTAPDRLTGIDVFVQAVDAGSFALAASRLGVTRSAIAKNIARLEQRLGTRLFHRTTRTQTLTEDGLAYYERCARALAEIDAAEGALDAGRREPVGRLRVTAPVVFGRMCVAPCLLQLTTRFARLDIDMTFTDSVIDLVGEGYDLGVRIGALPDSSSLSARKLGSMRMVICTAPEYLQRHGTPTSIDALSEHSGVVYKQGQGEVPWVLTDETGTLRAARVKSRIRVDDLQAILDAALAGVGLVWLPCWLVKEHLRSGKLVVVFGGEITRPNPIHAVWPHTRHLPAKTRVAIDALLEYVPQLLAYAHATDADVISKKPTTLAPAQVKD
ncbi:MAG: LysR family transcriptional regulator [Rhodocyclales bacterium]|nr:LysR family transcriptional regulator [Rhodocyclales bacterium]